MNDGKINFSELTFRPTRNCPAPQIPLQSAGPTTKYAGEKLQTFKTSLSENNYVFRTA